MSVTVVPGHKKNASVSGSGSVSAVLRNGTVGTVSAAVVVGAPTSSSSSSSTRAVVGSPSSSARVASNGARLMGEGRGVLAVGVLGVGVGVGLVG